MHGIDRGKRDLLLFAAGKGENVAPELVLNMQCLCGLRHTPFHLLLRHSTIVAKSAALILIFTRQVRGFGFSIPRVTDATESSSAALEAAVRSGT